MPFVLKLVTLLNSVTLRLTSSEFGGQEGRREAYLIQL